jgi:hypothetical protein
MSTAAKKGNGGAVGTRHVTRSAQEARALLSNVQPEKRRDVSCWPKAEVTARRQQGRFLG